MISSFYGFAKWYLFVMIRISIDYRISCNFPCWGPKNLQRAIFEWSNIPDYKAVCNSRLPVYFLSLP